MHGELKVPVVGVALNGWTLDQLKERARDSLAHSEHGIDDVAFPKLLSLLRYVDGDYGDAETFAELRRQLGKAAHPLHYLAIPPSLFGLVVQQLQASGCADGGRVVIEKPFGHDGASAEQLNEVVTSVFAEDDIYRIDHFLGKEAVENLVYFRFANSFMEPLMEPELRREHPDHHGRGVRGRRSEAPSTTPTAPSATWCRTTSSR